jgi:hypothetical protein
MHTLDPVVQGISRKYVLNCNNIPQNEAILRYLKRYMMA